MKIRNKFIMWILKKIANGRPIMMNFYLTSGLYVDYEKTRSDMFIYNVHVNIN